MTVARGWSVRIVLGHLAQGVQQTRSQTSPCSAGPSSLSLEAWLCKGHCCVPPPCTLTHFSCSLVFSSTGHFVELLLDSNFERRPKPSGTVLRRSLFFMETLLWRPALSQKCPLPVPACGHRTATQHGCDQAARALRPYTNTRDQKESVEVEREEPWKSKCWCSWQCCHAGTLVPSNSAHKNSPCSSKMALEEGSQEEKNEGVHCWRHHRVQNCQHQIQGWRGDGRGLQVGKHGSDQKQGDHSQGTGHGFRDRGGDGAQVKNREVEEEEVHGGVEAVVAGYSSDDEAIAQEGSQVDAQEEPEVQELQLPRVCKRQEEELDEGVHCWRNQRVQNSHHQIQRWGGDGGGPQIGKYGSAEKHGDHSQVRDARGKGFVPSLLRGDPQHSPEDLHIGQHNENKTSKNKKSTNHNKANFPEVGIGHGFGDSGGDGAQVKNREVEEEEVHGGVEAVVTGYSSDDEAIAQDDSHVDAQEEPEVQELQIPPCVHERQEEELGDGAAVGHLLTLCKGPGQGGKVSDKEELCSSGCPKNGVSLTGSQPYPHAMDCFAQCPTEPPCTHGNMSMAGPAGSAAELQLKPPFPESLKTRAAAPGRGGETKRNAPVLVPREAGPGWADRHSGESPLLQRRQLLPWKP
ncbi:hypothetical protein QYF61_006975 [Mycteria americana]|uniref:Uncharacterized protein n=1 Tax=Mycteria americana TaxID=33587 RepID=A0AAN7RS27_MYCAM|nr:hypothetical protein QYF61_006975 [Mycteria americana]